jgi:hypothetical protein
MDVDVEGNPKAKIVEDQESDVDEWKGIPPYLHGNPEDQDDDADELKGTFSPTLQDGAELYTALDNCKHSVS